MEGLVEMGLVRAIGVSNFSVKQIEELLHCAKIVPAVNQATPLVAGISVAAAALGGRYLIQAWQAFKKGPAVPPMRRFYEGGFERAMTRREAALILGVREHAVMEKIKEAHRRVMVANHPDSGGSHYLASKINEAKDILSGKTKGGGSVF